MNHHQLVEALGLSIVLNAGLVVHAAFRSTTVARAAHRILHPTGGKRDLPPAPQFIDSRPPVSPEVEAAQVVADSLSQLVQQLKGDPP